MNNGCKLKHASDSARSGGWEQGCPGLSLFITAVTQAGLLSAALRHRFFPDFQVLSYLNSLQLYSHGKYWESQSKAGRRDTPSMCWDGV